MPVGRDGVGRGPGTRIKQAHFRTIVRAHIAITRSVLHKYPGSTYQRYQYVDLTAGDGRDPKTGEAGSPVIFLDEAGALEPIDLDAYLLELSDANCARLAEETHGRDGVHILPGDNARTVDDVIAALPRTWRRVHGLVYADPNGTDLAIEPLRRLAAAAPHLDILVSASATALKRGNAPRLLDALTSIGRAHTWIRQPLPGDGWHWTFVLMAGHPIFERRFGRALRLHAIDSPTGRAVAERLNWTEPEQRARAQRPLPLGMEWAR